MDRLQGTQGCRLVFTDSSGIVRADHIPPRHYQEMLDNGVQASVCNDTFIAYADIPCVDAGLHIWNDKIIRPDLSTLHNIPYLPNKGRGPLVRCFADTFEIDGVTPFPYDPRGFLKRMVRQAQEEFGLNFLMGIEEEFYLVGKNDQLLDMTDYRTESALNDSHEVLSEIMFALEEQGVDIAHVHPESAYSQFEFVLYHKDPLKIADSHLIFKDTVRSIAFQHNLKAIFVPKYKPEFFGNGLHIHYSLNRDGQNITADTSRGNKLSEIADQFTAGLLENISSLIALTCSSRNSYQRFLPFMCAGSTIGWGVGHKDVSIRISPYGPKGPSHIEYKLADMTCNPYIAIGGLIAAGLGGIRSKAQMPPEAPWNITLAPQEERERQGFKQVPQSFKEALDNLSANEVLRDAMGSLHALFLGVKRLELEHLERMGEEDIQKRDFELW